MKIYIHYNWYTYVKINTFDHNMKKEIDTYGKRF